VDVHFAVILRPTTQAETKLSPSLLFECVFVVNSADQDDSSRIPNQFVKRQAGNLGTSEYK
jgi:hypothetical protein